MYNDRYEERPKKKKKKYRFDIREKKDGIQLNILSYKRIFQRGISSERYYTDTYREQDLLFENNQELYESS